jgi:hypothetical protein
MLNENLSRISPISFYQSSGPVVPSKNKREMHLELNLTE